MNELVMQPIKEELEKLNQLHAKNNPKKSKRKQTKTPSQTPQNGNLTSSLSLHTEPTENSEPKEIRSESINNILVNKKEIRSELNSNVLVNKKRLSGEQIEKDIEELAYTDNMMVCLPKPLLDLKRKQEFELWKETVLGMPQKVTMGSEQTSLDDFFTQSISKKRRLSQSSDPTVTKEENIT